MPNSKEGNAKTRFNQKPRHQGFVHKLRATKILILAPFSPLKWFSLSAVKCRTHSSPKHFGI